MRRSVELAVVVVVGCGGGAKLDQSDVQSKVAAEAGKLVGVNAASAKCPNGITARAGASFSCDVTFRGGGTLAFKVDQVDAAGSLAVTPTGDWLLGDRMEKDLVTELFLTGHPGATVECGDAVMPIQIPANVECKVTNAGSAATKVAVAVDVQRNVDWKLVGAP